MKLSRNQRELLAAGMEKRVAGGAFTVDGEDDADVCALIGAGLLEAVGGQAKFRLTDDGWSKCLDMVGGAS